MYHICAMSHEAISPKALSHEAISPKAVSHKCSYRKASGLSENAAAARLVCDTTTAMQVGCMYALFAHHYALLRVICAPCLRWLFRGVLQSS